VMLSNLHMQLEDCEIRNGAIVYIAKKIT